VPELIAGSLNPTRLLLDLQQAGEIAQGFSGCLDPSTIARCTTDGLVNRFNCAFARIWLVEPELSALRLVASSGLYTRIDGSFARVPMGAYKVGKIAQNRVSFLSNNLAEEAWVKDRTWAISNRIRGFAGFPLMVENRVIGVLAAFSHDALAPEFLEVLQLLCTLVSVVLETALRHQQESSSAVSQRSSRQQTLSDQVAAILEPVRLTLIGTEQSLNLSQTWVFLEAAEKLKQLGCRYCRLLYQSEGATLEAIVTLPPNVSKTEWLRSQFASLSFVLTCLGGRLQSEAIAHQDALQIVLSLPYSRSRPELQLQILCRQPLLQLALTHLAQTAGMQVSDRCHSDIPLLTDDPTQLHCKRQIIWVKQGDYLPPNVNSWIDLSTSAAEFRAVLERVKRGESTIGDRAISDTPLLSEREREILGLLVQGLRDRDIAHRLVISESTVKFHMNNVLTKLKARTRYQAIHQAIKQHWL
jgi:DNA-binding CsgD family transcriptional regulator